LDLVDATLNIAFQYATEKFNELLDKIKAGKLITKRQTSCCCT